MFKKFTDGCVSLVNRFLPDPYIFCIVLTIIVFIGAIPATGANPLDIIIKGSIDGVEYKDLRKVSATTNTDVLIRRTPSSVKYLKFVVKSGSLQSSIRLIRFDTEHYLRFVRRMR